MSPAKRHDRRQLDRRMEDHPKREIHRLMNRPLSRFEVDQRRRDVASEPLKICPGAIGCHP
jgi:hypothetical protein